MKTSLICLFMSLLWLPQSRATDSLTVEQLRQLAVQNSPLQQKKTAG